MKIGKVVKYCVLGFIGVCVIYNPELLPGALCYASLYGVVRYTVMKKRKSKEIQAQRSRQNTKAPGQPVKMLQESETFPVQLAFGGIGFAQQKQSRQSTKMPGQPVQRLQESEIAKMRSCAEFAQHEMDRQAQESEAKTTSGVAVKPSEPHVQDAEKGIEWARQRLARKAEESEKQVETNPEVFVKPVEVRSIDPKKGIEWARSKLCKEVPVYDEPVDSIFSSDLDVDLIASMIETKPVTGADGIAYARSLLASDVDGCIDDQEPVKHEDGISYARSLLTSDTDECIDEPEPATYEDGISYARSLLSRDSGVVKEEPNPVLKPEEHEPVGGTFGVTEKDIETCRVVAAFFRAYYSSRYNLV